MAVIICIMLHECVFHVVLERRLIMLGIIGNLSVKVPGHFKTKFVAAPHIGVNTL